MPDMDWSLLVAAAGIETLGMATLPPPPLDFTQQEEED